MVNFESKANSQSILPDKLKVSNMCNNNCLFCSSDNQKAKTHHSYKEIIDKINLRKTNGETSIVFPCNFDNRADFIKILKHAKESGFHIILETNGRIFSYNNLAEKASHFIDEIILFYHGCEEVNHERVTQVKGSYKQSQKGEKNLRKFNNKVILKQIPWLEESDFGQSDYPQEIMIEVTSKCNFNCKGCFNKNTFAKTDRNITDMSTDRLKQVLDNIVELGTQRVRFTGGEPLMRDDLEELLEYAKSIGLEIFLNTNATCVNNENIKYIEKYVSNVLVSINGFNDDNELEWTQTKGSFKDKLNGIKVLIESKIPAVRAGTVATSENIVSLDKIYQIVKENKFTSWEIFNPVSAKKGLISDEEYIQLYNKIINLSLDSGKWVNIANSIPFCIFEKEKISLIAQGGKCDLGYARLVIDPLGNVKPDYFSDKIIGTVDNLLECWNHPVFKKLRNYDFIEDDCKRCTYLDRCKGKNVDLYWNSLSKL